LAGYFHFKAGSCYSKNRSDTHALVPKFIGSLEELDQLGLGTFFVFESIPVAAFLGRQQEEKE